MTDFPTWAVKLARRLLALTPGVYQIILTVDRDATPRWTVTLLGKREG